MPKYDQHRFPYRWQLSDGYPAKGIEPHGCTVFGTFICGGGSSMGYKLAGFHHLGGVEIDPVVADTYKLNHQPEYLYNMDLRDFNELQDLPAELYNLDLLDGSPPCSTFSTAGSRDAAWGKEKHFTEGQKLQTLDDLVFVYCNTILKLRPKVFLLENVSGIIKGNAKSYARRIVEYMTENGYQVQVFCLNAATMGVPQMRERVFFIGHKKEHHLPKLVLQFNEKPIPFGEVEDTEGFHEPMTDYMKSLWEKRQYGDNDMGDIKLRTEGKTSLFSHGFLYKNKVAPTITSTNREKHTSLFDRPVYINDKEITLCSTFPTDYQSPNKPIGWFCGMSVPPVMTAQIAYQIYLQWLANIK